MTTTRAARRAALEEEFGTAKLFRPYRDVRFGTDKSPYKNSQGAVIGMGVGDGALYVAVSADGLEAGGGFYRMSKDQLARYRAAVLDDAAGNRLVSVVDTLRGNGFTLVGETLIRAPRGVDPGHPRIALLRHKVVAAAHEFGSPAWLSTPKALDRVRTAWLELAPLNAWLAAEVGAAEAVEGSPQAGLSPAARAAAGRSARSR